MLSQVIITIINILTSLIYFVKLLIVYLFIFLNFFDKSKNHLKEIGITL